MNKKDVNDFIRKSRANSSPGNQSISYKMYKHYLKFRKQLFLMLGQMIQKENVSKRWFVVDLPILKEMELKI